MAGKGSTVLSFLLGAATGAVLGILYAPDRGVNTRDKLSFKLDKYKEMLEELIDELIQEKEEPLSLAKSEGEKVINDAKEKAERLLEDVDELIGSMKNENK